MNKYELLELAYKIGVREASVDYNNDRRKELAHTWFREIISAIINNTEPPSRPKLLTISPQ